MQKTWLTWKNLVCPPLVWKCPPAPLASPRGALAPPWSKKREVPCTRLINEHSAVGKKGQFLKQHLEKLVKMNKLTETVQSLTDSFSRHVVDTGHKMKKLQETVNTQVTVSSQVANGYHAARPLSRRPVPWTSFSPRQGILYQRGYWLFSFL